MINSFLFVLRKHIIDCEEILPAFVLYANGKYYFMLQILTSDFILFVVLHLKTRYSSSSVILCAAYTATHTLALVLQ